MHKSLLQPILAILIGLLVVMGAVWAVNPTSGFFTLFASSATGPQAYRYAHQPAGLTGPAGQCVVCHSVEKQGPLRVAPNLWGIVDAPKARMPGYGYSKALATAGGTWTAKDLEAYLANPGQFMPGTSKTIIGVSDPKESAQIVKFLGALKD